FTVAIGAAKIFAEATTFELHLAAALVAVEYGAFIAFNSVLAFFHGVAGAVGIVTADMELGCFIDQVGIHGCAAKFTALFVQQQAGFRFFVFIGVHHFVTGDKIFGAFAALFRWQ